MSSSWEGWTQSPGTGWWTWHGSNQEWVKAYEEESTDWHAAREQARTANCGGSAAVAAASDTAVAADAGQ